MNAIFLWSCFLSRPGSLSQHEQHYLSRTQDSIPDALAQPSRILDVIQASCLLAKYLYACGRLVEASYHASAAATLAVHVGLHRVASLQPPVLPWAAVITGSTSLQLDPPMDVIEIGERISVFWQAFVLDRCLAAALQRPSCIVDDDSFMSKIDTPWPEEIEEYATVCIPTILIFISVCSLGTIFLTSHFFSFFFFYTRVSNPSFIMTDFVGFDSRG